MTKQRIGVVLRSARLRVARDGELSFKNDQAFRKWVQAAVRIEKTEGADPSLDLWGTPLRHSVSARGLTVKSAGPDKSFETKDDISATANVFDY